MGSHLRKKMLHSKCKQTRNSERTANGKREGGENEKCKRTERNWENSHLNHTEHTKVTHEHEDMSKLDITCVVQTLVQHTHAHTQCLWTECLQLKSQCFLQEWKDSAHLQQSLPFCKTLFLHHHDWKLVRSCSVCQYACVLPTQLDTICISQKQMRVYAIISLSATPFCSVCLNIWYILHV